MTDSFLLLVFPMRTLTIHLGGHRDCLGLSLRGACTTEAAAAHLAQAVEQLLSKGAPQAWIDCRSLTALEGPGQQALVQAEYSARACGTDLYWCGLPAPLLSQLAASGLATQLRLRPAADFRGPQFLLVSAASYVGHQRQRQA